ncbi:MAG: hypothetical protein BGO21_29780 [Dyadobacter sp. 50-39]|uniref:DUF4133 domain-containing protein n=1 Tax=Dyadobacter sp. 50-39 TaxID=1895756 RepID=UPI000962CB44|nr:DUF4133 domain-containing protein [Dyadobacter sp. 50-39]OJV15258.1 MAG: hypothetical protein BGO21_29780 [Dyadobacter sp. 50-39]
MARITYLINKGINRSIVFRGLKGQYIWYAGGAMFAVMILYAVLYLCRVNTYLCLLIAVFMACILLTIVYQLSASFGEHGLTKALAARKIPDLIKARSRKQFIKGRQTASSNGKTTR